MRGNRKRQPHVHPARIPLDRSVDECLDASEIDDLIESALDFAFAHPENGAAQKNVLASAQLGLKTRADFEQRGHASVDRCRS